MSARAVPRRKSHTRKVSFTCCNIAGKDSLTNGFITVYADASVAATNPDAMIFNCAQRALLCSALPFNYVLTLGHTFIGAHQNTLENMPLVIILCVHMIILSLPTILMTIRLFTALPSVQFNTPKSLLASSGLGSPEDSSTHLAILLVIPLSVMAAGRGFTLLVFWVRIRLPIALDGGPDVEFSFNSIGLLGLSIYTIAPLAIAGV